MSARDYTSCAMAADATRSSSFQAGRYDMLGRFLHVSATVF